MNRVIINADDFGINDNVTRNTEELINKGLISSTTIMANGHCLEEVASFAKQHPEISYGIHFCLDEFDSLTKSSVLFDYGLTDKDGVFVKGGVFVCERYDERLKKAVYDELCAQVERLLALGIPISHADSHHLVHTRVSKLQNTFISVFKKYGIEKVRIGEIYSLRKMIKSHKNTSPTHTNMKSFSVVNNTGNQKGKIIRGLTFVKAQFRQLAINYRYKKNFKTTDYFFFYSGLLKNTSMANKMTNATIELMCHPGHPSPVYQFEICQIESNKLDEKMNYKLISYNEL